MMKYFQLSFAFLLIMFSAVSVNAQNNFYPNNREPLNKTKFVKLPLGAVKPKGWLHDQLTVQANGLTGHLSDVWEIINKSSWKGDSGINVLPECCYPRFVPRWLEGLVPLAYQLDDERLKGIANTYMGYLMKVQDVGRVTTSMVAWSHLGRVLQGYYEATGDKRAIGLCLKILDYCNQIKDVKSRAIVAPERLGMVLGFGWWGYNMSGDKKLLTTVDAVSKANVEDWKDYFINFKDRDSTAKEGYPVKRNDMGRHGVDVAQAFQYPISYFLNGKDDSYIRSVFQGIENLDKYNGQVTGRFTADEYLAGLKPTQGTELCTITESVYSLEKSFEAIGDVSFADRMERLVFNALPGTCTGDFWAHQYDQQANQVLVSKDETRLWHMNDATANVFGFTPHYSCCLSNMHSPFPRYVENMWMATEDNGLVAVAYGPSEVKAKVAGNTDVTITQETTYPFSGIIRFTVNVSAPAQFPLYFRIPSWADRAILTVGGKVVQSEKGTLCKVERQWSTGDLVTLKLNPTLRTESRYNNAASLTWGPLDMVLRIGQEFKKIDIRMDRPIKPSIPTGVANWQISATTPWNYALVIDRQHPTYTIEYGTVGKLPFARKGEPVFLANAADFVPWDGDVPLVIKMKARRLESWKMDGANAGDVPLQPVSSAKDEMVELIPYGCTRLRISEFPVIAPGKK